jgi:hypothetical protein
MEKATSQEKNLSGVILRVTPQLAISIPDNQPVGTIMPCDQLAHTRELLTELCLPTNFLDYYRKHGSSRTPTQSLAGYLADLTGLEPSRRAQIVNYLGDGGNVELRFLDDNLKQRVAKYLG